MATLRLLTGALLVVLLAAQTPTKKKSEKELQAAFDAHKGDFDYLLGEWEFTSVSKEYGPGKGFWTAVRLDTGQILDEFRVVGNNRETWYVTSTLRSYNAGLDRWELVGMVEGGGLQDVGTGQRVGGEVARLDEEALTMAQIGEQLGISAASVCRMLKAHRIQRRVTEAIA